MAANNVFNIGTNHTQTETNNMIAALGHACTAGPDFVTINDGPTGPMGNLIGWGMNSALKSTVAKIKAAARDGRIDRVNMTGHSRGAILCHMISHALANDKSTKELEIRMFLVDPVHQSILNHAGGERLTNPKLVHYRAIVMQNENTGFLGWKMFPFKFVAANEDTREHMRYIPMPGRHGSATQQLTSAVGQVTAMMIARYMNKNGTPFASPFDTKLSNLEYCQLFAKIHIENPLAADGVRRLLFDDAGTSKVHSSAKDSLQGSGSRHNAVKRAMSKNRKVDKASRQRLSQLVSPYFFNVEHARHFSKAFPNCFAVLSKTPAPATDREWADAEVELASMTGPLGRAMPLLLAQMLLQQPT
ncbi:MAG: hypothetical protein K0Q76_3361 [Panacagrimonas sp.]|nr:hypothetical protein [Panacagrimonas sp.]